MRVDALEEIEERDRVRLRALEREQRSMEDETRQARQTQRLSGYPRHRVLPIPLELHEEDGPRWKCAGCGAVWRFDDEADDSACPALSMLFGGEP